MRLRFTFTASARYVTDNITVSNEAIRLILLIMNNEIKYDRTEQLLRSNVRIDVLATIDELNQYLLGNVTLEAATDAARELTHKLNDQW